MPKNDPWIQALGIVTAGLIVAYALSLGHDIPMEAFIAGLIAIVCGAAIRGPDPKR